MKVSVITCIRTILPIIHNCYNRTSCICNVQNRIGEVTQTSTIGSACLHLKYNLFVPPEMVTPATIQASEVTMALVEVPLGLISTVVSLVSGVDGVPTNGAIEWRGVSGVIRAVVVCVSIVRVGSDGNFCGKT